MTVDLRVDAVPGGPALLLRPWGDEDIEPLIEVYRDPALRRWTSLSMDSTEDAQRWLEVQKDGWESRTRLSFAILENQRDAGERRLLGNVVLKRNEPSGRSAEVGYWTAAHARGRGVATRALEALTLWAFDAFAAECLDRLELLHQVDNHASCRVAEKARYQFERVLPARPPFPRDGHLHARHARVVAAESLQDLFDLGVKHDR
ncbi:MULTISPECIES: GNAT family N-acetyltransferase [unclassified Micromonospora]|uniref:GNAT family N-acetyltransferase n=1 Tax=unclassified Micromonospora TaxID=2617518 RepID=UPI002FF27FE7